MLEIELYYFTLFPSYRHFFSLVVEMSSEIWHSECNFIKALKNLMHIYISIFIYICNNHSCYHSSLLRNVSTTASVLVIHSFPSWGPCQPSPGHLPFCPCLTAPSIPAPSSALHPFPTPAPSAVRAFSLLSSHPFQLYQSLYIHHIKENISWSSLLSPSVNS